MSPKEVMEQQVIAYNERNLDKFLDCFSDDIEFFELKDNSKSLSGKTELKQVFENLFSKTPNLDLKIKSRIVSGNYVTDLEIVHGPKSYPKGAEVMSVNFIENGVIRKIWFSDTIIY